MARNNVFSCYYLLVTITMCVCLSVAAAAVAGITTATTRPSLVRSSEPEAIASNEERVTDFTISESKDSVSWTAFGRQWIVHLELSNVVEDNTDYYHGTLEGDASAVVSFALLPGLSLSGMIAIGPITYWIRALPVIENDLSEAESDLGIFMIEDQASVMLNPGSVLADPLDAGDIAATLGGAVDSCNSGLDVSADAVTEDASTDSQGKRTTISSYKVGVLFDQKWAQASNNPWSSQANTIALFNDVNAIYKAANLGQFTAYYLKQITNTQTTLNDMLNYFSGTASKTISAFTDKSYTNYIWLIGANVGGLAYVGTTCKGSAMAQNKKTAVAGLVSYSRLYTVKTIAHELGHTRGATHQFDGACSSTVKTNCQCSLMSYCFPTATNNPQGAVNWLSDHTIGEMHAAGCY